MNVLKILIVLACFFSTVTMAQTPVPSPKPTFKDIDKNGDGSLTPEEFFWD